MTELDFSGAAVLVVEDNEFIRITLRKYLGDMGFRGIFEAANGKEAIKLLDEKPHLIICDINMEPLNGFDFVKYVRSVETPTTRVPIIFLTGDAHQHQVEEAIGLGADAYLLKPVTVDSLRNRIVSVMLRKKIPL